MQKKLNECEIGGRYVVSGVQVDELSLIHI